MMKSFLILPLIFLSALCVAQRDTFVFFPTYTYITVNGYPTNFWEDSLHDPMCIGDTIEIRMNADTAAAYGIDSIRFKFTLGASGTTEIRQLVSHDAYSERFVFTDTAPNQVYIINYSFWFHHPTYMATRSSGQIIVDANPVQYYRWRFGDLMYIQCCHAIGSLILSTSDSSICYGDTATLTATGPYMHLRWSTGDSTRSIRISEPGPYTCIAYGACRSDTQSILIRPRCHCPVAYTKSADTTICAQSLAYIYASLPARFRLRWNTGDTAVRIRVSQTGTYIFTGTYYCDTIVDSIRVMMHAPLTPIHRVQVSCSDSTVVLTANRSGNLSYRWIATADTSSQINAHTSGSYLCTVSDQCISVTDTFDILISPLPSRLFNDDTLRVCEAGFPVLITLDSAYLTYVWNGAAGGQSFLADSALSLIATVGTVCGIASDTLQIIAQPHRDHLSVTIDTACNSGTAAIHLDYEDHPYIIWSSGGHTADITAPIPSYITVILEYPCDTLYRDIIIPACTHIDCTVFIPNAFSPNGDGINDVFLPLSDCEYEYFHMRIYDRWGELVYSTDTYAGWDGSFKSVVTPGVYVYVLDYGFGNVSGQHTSSSITLIK